MGQEWGCNFGHYIPFRFRNQIRTLPSIIDGFPETTFCIHDSSVFTPTHQNVTPHTHSVILIQTMACKMILPNRKLKLLFVEIVHHW